MDTETPTVQHLMWIEEIKNLKSRYFRYTDTKQFDDWRSLFTTDATLLFHDVDTEPKPIAEMMGPLISFVSSAVTVHHGHMPEIEILSDTEARGIWAMEDRLHWEGDNPMLPGVSKMVGYGHYHETYVRLDGVWKIKTLELTRLRVETE